MKLAKISLLILTAVLVAGAAYYWLKPKPGATTATPLYLSAVYTIEQRSKEYNQPIDVILLKTLLNVKAEDYTAYANANPKLNSALYVYLTPVNYVSLVTSTATTAPRVVSFASSSDTKLLHQFLPLVVMKLSRAKERILTNTPVKVTTKDRLKKRTQNRSAPAATPGPPPITNPAQLKLFLETNAKELTYLKSLGLSVHPDAIPLPAAVDPYILQLLGSYKALPPK